MESSVSYFSFSFSFPFLFFILLPLFIQLHPLLVISSPRFYISFFSTLYSSFFFYTTSLFLFYSITYRLLFHIPFLTSIHFSLPAFHPSYHTTHIPSPFLLPYSCMFLIFLSFSPTSTILSFSIPVTVFFSTFPAVLNTHPFQRILLCPLLFIPFPYFVALTIGIPIFSLYNVFIPMKQCCEPTLQHTCTHACQ